MSNVGNTSAGDAASCSSRSKSVSVSASDAEEIREGE
eukprot:CAMPEP_0179452174 /NCGR_PEP_ID=MMETSP0799-20121207/36086_1 /TAXON_ID=46947 /ORGANISM="Geminigera cryophila, Strain CCMP2564" /LENGTH=36 /DNA_ID= /DNA_START= /DNA_END= /DNA_ORIENTATION=